MNIKINYTVLLDVEEAKEQIKEYLQDNTINLAVEEIIGDLDDVFPEEEIAFRRYKFEIIEDDKTIFGYCGSIGDVE